MGIGIKNFFAPRAAAKDRAPPPSVNELYRRAYDAHRRLDAASDRLLDLQEDGNPWSSTVSPEEQVLRGEVKQAKRELKAALKAYMKATSTGFRDPVDDPGGGPSDQYSPGSQARPPPRSPPPGPTPPPPPSRGPSATHAGAAGAARREATVASQLGQLLASTPYAAREALVGKLDLAELTAVEADLVGHLRRSPELGRALGQAFKTNASFNRALFNVHPDKNRPNAEKSATLHHPDPATHRAQVEGYLAKLDVVRNILNRGRELAKKPELAKLFVA